METRTVCTLDAEPKHGEDGARDYAEISKVVSERTSCSSVSIYVHVLRSSHEASAPGQPVCGPYAVVSRNEDNFSNLRPPSQETRVQLSFLGVKKCWKVQIHKLTGDDTEGHM